MFDLIVLLILAVSAVIGFVRGAVREVVTVVNDWRKHYAACGVTRGDIELYAEQIDRPFLLEQRQEFTG